MANDTTRQTVPISFRLPSELASRLDARAETAGQSRGEFVRALVLQAVGEEPPQASAPAASLEPLLIEIRSELSALRTRYTGVDENGQGAASEPTTAAGQLEELKTLRAALLQQKQTIQQAWARIQAELRGLRESVDTVDTDLLRKDHLALLEVLKVIGGKQNELDEFQKKRLAHDVARVKQLVSMLRNDHATAVLALLTNGGKVSIAEAREWVKASLLVEE